MDKISFNMASIPQRKEALRESVYSILPQCDELNIYLNEWPEVPDFLKHPKINVFVSQNEIGDMGDVGKFYQCDTWKGYVFTVDDKIIYPVDYTRSMIEAIEKYKRKAVVSCHGRNMKPNCSSYYWDNAAFFCVYSTLDVDTWAHELGTGCMAFHTDTFEASLEMFPHINMTDIYFSMALQTAKVPILIKKHNQGWIRMSKKHDDNYSIHNFCNRDDGFQTKIVNDFQWKLNKVRVL